MFCKNCGKKNEEKERFCGKCGCRIDSSTPTEVFVTPIITEEIEEDIFYSEDWQQKKVLVVASFPYFDVMVDKKYLYIIRIPKYYSAPVFTIIGLCVLSLVGAGIGYYLGAQSDEKKRKKYRSSWVDLNHNIISNDYIKDILIKIPLNQIKNEIEFGTNRFKLKLGNENIVLKKGQKEFIKFKETIQKHVL